jgi:thiol-disulfide isomerase/thioredoxin
MKARHLMRPKAILPVVIAIAVLALVTGIVNNWPKSETKISPQAQSPLISQPRPDFAMPDLAGTQRNIKEWDGKVLAVNFWATWCEPCKQEIADFNILQKQYGSKGFQFIGVALDDQEAVQTYLKTSAIVYPVLIGEDEAANVATHYGDDEGVVPYTAFVDRKGRIAYIQYGAMSQALAREVIESLL